MQFTGVDKFFRGKISQYKKCIFLKKKVTKDWHYLQSTASISPPELAFQFTYILVPRPKLGGPSQWPWFRLLSCIGFPTQRLGRSAYALLPKNMATAMNATLATIKKQ